MRETLEEAAERLYPGVDRQVDRMLFINGAKWQQDKSKQKRFIADEVGQFQFSRPKMYSEEYLDAFRKFMIQEQNFSKSCLDVFVEQFKKK